MTFFLPPLIQSFSKNGQHLFSFRKASTWNKILHQQFWMYDLMYLLTTKDNQSECLQLICCLVETQNVLSRTRIKRKPKQNHAARTTTQRNISMSLDSWEFEVICCNWKKAGFKRWKNNVFEFRWGMMEQLSNLTEAQVLCRKIDDSQVSIYRLYTLQVGHADLFPTKMSWVIPGLTCANPSR